MNGLNGLDSFKRYDKIMTVMASLHKDPRGKSPFWYCAYTLPAGERKFRSTKTGDKAQAKEICRVWANAAIRGDKLTPDTAREVIARGVADVLAASGQVLPNATIREWSKRWLECKALENEPRTHERYETTMNRFLEFLGKKADKD